MLSIMVTMEEPATTDSDWHEVKRLFGEAMAMPEEERMPFLLASTAHTSVVREVADLLHNADHTATDGASPVADEAHAAQSGSRDVPERAGNWRLRQRIGVGGMGEVFLADRADGAYQGQAAVKLLKSGKPWHV
jgi:eukaryotic-like serine/threonine-protein kinase